MHMWRGRFCGSSCFLIMRLRGSNFFSYPITKQMKHVFHTELQTKGVIKISVGAQKTNEQNF